MKEFWTSIQVVLAAVGGWLGWFLGGCDGLLYALVAFVAADYITGVMPAEKLQGQKKGAPASTKKLTAAGI